MSALRLRRHCAMPSKGEQRGEGCTAGGTPLRLTRILGVASGVQRESVAAHQIRRQLLAPAILSACFRNISAQVEGIGVTLHDSATGGTAYAVFIAPQRLNRSFPRSWLRRDVSEIHQDCRNRPQLYRLDKRPVRDKRYRFMIFCVQRLSAITRRRL
jgi:hypothetical protein